jgi:hypothetical protein
MQGPFENMYFSSYVLISFWLVWFCLCLPSSSLLTYNRDHCMHSWHCCQGKLTKRYALLGFGEFCFCLNEKYRGWGFFPAAPMAMHSGLGRLKWARNSDFQTRCHSCCVNSHSLFDHTFLTVYTVSTSLIK